LNISWRRSSRPDSRNFSNHEPHNHSEIRHAGPPLRHGNVITGSYIQRELPRVEMPETLRGSASQACAELIATPS
jgi:hypothetical protein